MHQINHFQSILHGLPREVSGFSLGRIIKFDDSYKTRSFSCEADAFEDDEEEEEAVAPRLNRAKSSSSDLWMKEKIEVIIKEFAKGEFTVADVAKKINVSTTAARSLLKKITETGVTDLKEAKMVGSGGQLAFRFDGKEFTKSMETLQKLIMTTARSHAKVGVWFRAAALVDLIKFYIYSRKYKIELIKTVLKESGEFDFAIKKCPEGDRVFVFRRKGVGK